MTTRRPVPATESTALPSLDEVTAKRPASPYVIAAAGVVVFAGGAVLASRHAPVCGRSRWDEVDPHGGRVLGDLQRMEVTKALREVAIAAGWIAHDEVARTGVMAPGAMPAVTTLPVPQVAPPDLRPRARGEMMQVGPEPPMTDGAIRPVTPDPPRPMGGPPVARPGGLRPVQPHGKAGRR